MAKQLLSSGLGRVSGIARSPSLDIHAYTPMYAHIRQCQLADAGQTQGLGALWRRPFDELSPESSSFRGLGHGRARLPCRIVTASLGRSRCVSARLEQAGAERPVAALRFPRRMGLGRLPAVLAGPDDAGLSEVTPDRGRPDDLYDGARR